MQITSTMVEIHIVYLKSDEPEFLVLTRSETEIFPGIKQPITGSIKNGEKAYETAIREVKEETGIEVNEFYSVPIVNSFYSASSDCLILIPVFAVVVKSKNVVLSEEHSAYQWLTLEEAQKCFAWDGQRRAAALLHEYFTKKDSSLLMNQIKF